MSIYLNTASSGLISENAIQTNLKLYNQFLNNASGANASWHDEQYWKIKEQVGSLLHCTKENIAFLPNMSYAINMIVQSLHGDEKVLLYKQDFPSLNLPFEHNHFDITYVDSIREFEISLEDIEKIIVDRSINIVAISHVQWMSGFKIDLNKLSILCKKYNVWLIIDGTQSMGAIDINLSKDNAPDVFIASNYKWMNAGYGSGILYANDLFLNSYPPIAAGNNSSNKLIENSNASICLFEPGHINIHSLCLMQSELEFKLNRSIKNIENENIRLASLLINAFQELSIELLGDYSMENRSSIIALKDQDGLANFLKKNEIIVTERFGLIRIAIHYYNSQKDIESTIEVLKKWKSLQ